MQSRACFIAKFGFLHCKVLCFCIANSMFSASVPERYQRDASGKLVKGASLTRKTSNSFGTPNFFRDSRQIAKTRSWTTTAQIQIRDISVCMCLELGSKKQTQQHRAIPYSAKCNPMIKLWTPMDHNNQLCARLLQHIPPSRYLSLVWVEVWPIPSPHMPCIVHATLNSTCHSHNAPFDSTKCHHNQPI